MRDRWPGSLDVRDRVHPTSWRFGFGISLGSLGSCITGSQLTRCQALCSGRAGAKTPVARRARRPDEALSRNRIRSLAACICLPQREAGVDLSHGQWLLHCTQYAGLLRAGRVQSRWTVSSSMPW